MKRQRKVKKTLLQKLRKKIHSLTAPKRVPRKRKRTLKAENPNSPNPVTKELNKIENELSRKMTEDMKKIRQEMEQDLLQKLTTTIAKPEEDTNLGSNSNPGQKKRAAKQAGPKRSRKLSRSTDYSFLKVLFLSDNRGKKVVVGYEVLDNSSKEIWGIDIHEGTCLCRAKKIVDTKLKSRKVEQERQYYLVNTQDEKLYYTDDYAKEAMKRGKIAVNNYTAELAEAIKFAVELGYGGPKKKRQTK
ncbi:hypothetical protein SAMN02799624_04925 [Paenibacillus sp. UNC496MF]|uniref:hypothetical protein n=1 Tax=Paenibacillus sp. UNC496MF TaxID=1502753 RepID=UPI0008E2D60B|nr:hypothetical protein [Paenibacillus sp. UNC496MF]SFJ54326.1 hypothetical protein SAMN02799624_04925 [Paenibacillus sp. UNC496MF]